MLLERMALRCLDFKMFCTGHDLLQADCRANPLGGLKYISELPWERLVTPKEQLHRIMNEETFGDALLVPLA